MDIIIISSFAMGLRILILGAERIYLKKLQLYDSLVISTFFSLIASAALTPLLFFIPNIQIQFFNASRFAIISSLSYTVAFFLYVKAISLEDASLIAPLYNSSLFFIFIFGSLVLREVVTIFRVFGGLLIFFGMFMLYSGSFSEKITEIKESRGSIYMFVGSIFLAVGRTIDAYSITRENVDPRLYAFLIYFYVGFYTLILVLLSGRRNKIRAPFKFNLRNLLLAGIANGWAYLFLLIALQAIDLSIAVPLSLLSVFVTAYFAKLFLDENINQRIPGTIVIYIGALLLFF